jgi:hypothetical protein
MRNSRTSRGLQLSITTALLRYYYYFQFTTEMIKLPKVEGRNVCTVHKKEPEVNNVTGKSLQKRLLYK